MKLIFDSDTLFGRLMKYNTLLIFIALLILSSIFGRLVTRYFSGLRELDATSNGKKVAKMVSDNINDYRFKNTTLDENRKEIYKVAENSNYKITIIDKSGSTLISSSINKNFTFSLLRNETEKILSGNRLIKKVIGNNINYMLIAFPLASDENQKINIVENQRKNEDIIGAIILQTPLENMTGTINKLFKMVIISALIALIVAFLINISFAKHTTKPLMKVKKAAIDIGEGKYNRVKIPENSTEEIIKMIETFNYAVTQIEKNFSRKKRLEKMRKEVVADISHEFRAPLTSLKGFLELFLEKDLEEEEINKYAKIMHNDTEYLEKLVNDLLTLGQLDSEYLQLDLEKINIKDIICRAINSLKTKLNKKNISIKLKMGNKIPKIKVDKLRIHQVLINLLENAINYSPQNSEIIIKTEIVSDEIKISIIDNGPGIPEDKLNDIWERFYKIDKARTRQDKKGSGLGLSIVKNIIKQHGGWVKAENKENKGAVFSFYLRLEN